jgi:hypothetical protein
MSGPCILLPYKSQLNNCFVYGIFVHVVLKGLQIPLQNFIDIILKEVLKMLLYRLLKNISQNWLDFLAASDQISNVVKPKEEKGN